MDFFAPCTVRESGKFLFLEFVNQQLFCCGIRGNLRFEIRNSALGIRNSTNDGVRLKSKFHWQRILKPVPQESRIQYCPGLNMGRIVINHLRISLGGLRSFKLQGRDRVEGYEGELTSDIALK